MLIRTLKSYQPFNLLIFLAISILVWVRPMTDHGLIGIYTDNDMMPFYSAIVNLIGTPNFNFLCKIIAFLLIVLQALIFNGILNQYNLLGFRSYLPGIIFILISSNFEEFQILHPALIANIFILFAWRKVIGTYENANTFEAYFNASLLIGLSTLFYPNYVYFLLIIFLNISMNRVADTREFAMIFVGFITVWYFYLSLFLLFTNSIQHSGLNFDFTFSFPKYAKLFLSQKIFLMYISLLILAASFLLGGFMSNLKIPMRRNLKFLFLWFWIGILLLVFTQSSIEIIYIVSFPVAALLSLFFVNLKKKWPKEIFWILFLLIIILNQAFPQLLKI